MIPGLMYYLYFREIFGFSRFICIIYGSKDVISYFDTKSVPVTKIDEEFINTLSLVDLLDSFSPEINPSRPGPARLSDT